MADNIKREYDAAPSITPGGGDSNIQALLSNSNLALREEVGGSKRRRARAGHVL